MVVLPNPTMVTVFPATVATAGFVLVYVNAPSPLVVGGTSVNGSSPIILGATEKLERIVLARFTCNKVLTVADV